MKHQPSFICANFHAFLHRERLINYAQRQSENHCRAMPTHPEARVHMDKAATIASDVQSRLYRAASATEAEPTPDGNR
jgi:hypothetical protein